MSLQPNQQQVNDRSYQWFDTASGRYLQLQEQGLYDQAVVDLFGFNAVQMGCPQMDLLRNSRIPHRYKSSDLPDASIKTDLQCCDDFLPFADSSLDLLLLPHRLEFSERPHQTLREAERVMMPEGIYSYPVLILLACGDWCWYLKIYFQAGAEVKHSRGIAALSGLRA
jgi:hypothetical protein